MSKVFSGRQSPEVIAEGRGTNPSEPQEIHSPGSNIKGQQNVTAQAGKTSPHMLACSSISLAENCNSQIGHWTQEGAGELSGEDTHSTDSEEDKEAGEAGGGGELSPQVAACWGRASVLKEPKEKR